MYYVSTSGLFDVVCGRPVVADSGSGKGDMEIGSKAKEQQVTDHRDIVVEEAGVIASA